MKNLIFALTFVCLGFASQAHIITDINCASGGKIRIEGTQFNYNDNSDPKSDSVAFYLKNADNSYTFIGSAIVTNGGDFRVDIPYYNQQGQTVYFKQFQRNNANSNYNQTWPGSGSANYGNGSGYANGYGYGFIKDTRCTVMPITLTSWTAKVDASDKTLVHLAWSVDMETNVNYYRIDGSTDNGVTWDTAITTLKSLGDTNAKRTYTLDYRNPLVDLITKTAGFGTLGLVLAIAVFAGSFRNRAIAGVVGCLMLVTFFACKKSLDKPAQTTKYNAVRLSNVDNDGTVKTFETRFLKD